MGFCRACRLPCTSECRSCSPGRAVVPLSASGASFMQLLCSRAARLRGRPVILWRSNPSAYGQSNVRHVQFYELRFAFAAEG